MDNFPEPTSPASGSPSLDAAEPALTILPPPEPSDVHHLFFGPFGLRAGWSLLIYIAILFACIMGVRIVQHHMQHKQHATAAAKAVPAAKPNPAKAENSEPEPMKGMIIGESILFAAFVFISWIMSRIERRSVLAYGLGGIHPIRRFLMGTFWGLVAMAILITILHFAHLVVFDARLDHGWAILGWGAAQLLGFLLVGLFEEYCFRGYLQYTLTRGMVGLSSRFSETNARAIAFWIAAVLTSALFFFAHTGNGGETPLGLLIVFLAGIVLVVALWRTGSLWWAIGFHMAWDWSQSFLYGVPDSGGLMQGRLFATHAIGKPLLSGGTDGPEGSLLCVPILLFLIVVLLFTHSSPQPPLELETPRAADDSDPSSLVAPLETAS